MYTVGGLFNTSNRKLAHALARLYSAKLGYKVPVIYELYFYTEEERRRS